MEDVDAMLRIMDRDDPDDDVFADLDPPAEPRARRPRATEYSPPASALAGEYRKKLRAILEQTGSRGAAAKRIDISESTLSVVLLAQEPIAARTRQAIDATLARLDAGSATETPAPDAPPPPLLPTAPWVAAPAVETVETVEAAPVEAASVEAAPVEIGVPETPATVETRICAECALVKPITDFNLNGHDNGRGRRRECRVCTRILARAQEAARRAIRQAEEERDAALAALGRERATRTDLAARVRALGQYCADLATYGETGTD